MTMKFSSFAIAAFGLLAVAGPTLAQIITNGSFETGTRGWIAQGNLRASAGFGVSDGTNALLFNSGDTTPNGVLSQAFPTTPGKRYLLRYDYGALSFYPSSRQSLAVSVSGATLLLSETNSVTTSSPNLSFSTYAYFFSADSLTTTLMFRDISPDTLSTDSELDNVRLTDEGVLLAITMVPAVFVQPIDRTYRVEYTEDLSGTIIWTALTNTCDTIVTPHAVADTTATNSLKRFYRAIPVP